MNECRVPGKIFLIGEYGVIQGGSAVIAALKPGFIYHLGGEPAHPDSPLGRFSKEQVSPIQIQLKKEQSLVLGLGSSTAELIAGYALTHQKLPTLESIWSWYQKHFPEASGADLAIQLVAMRTEKSIFSVRNKSEVKPFEKTPLFNQIYVFQTDVQQKLLTHEALKQKTLSRDALPACNQWVAKWEAAMKENQEEAFHLFSDFANFLASHGLETQHAARVRHAFSKLKFVLGVKGSGAGLNDLFLVAVKKSSQGTTAIDALHSIALEYHLKPLGILSELLW